MTLIDHYIAEQDAKFQPKLMELKQIIKNIVPEADEVISYMIPCFKKGKLFAGMGVTKKYVSFYNMNPPLLKKMGEEWNLNFKGSTVYFLPNEILPIEIIEKIVTQKLIEIEMTCKKKK